ncbi:protease PrsW [Polaribacter reichenbachii]|uniref:Protease PrsW n=1 Tax=Polaribacter reichenbachii TaxID=996801 RepID=A0A1B8TWJ0_9FLAO|nr:PrsW family glutamic-type intramembrane protease [Polaribacter reichenbachii]APZ45027.1 protease PrsW [Polaribacter reichenbachii]AUC18890.1 protease PrsW [Polaribacter reichenbachii]OBY63952.1 branched-chain amino acid aminotransferase [Polaribacter reichenbachii]
MNLLLLAVAPVMIVVVFIYLKDKYEKEPIHFLIKNFLLGAIVSVFVTLLLGAVASAIFPVTDYTNIFQQFIKAFFVVALVEEFSKYIIVRFYAQKNKEFNEPFDGIVYAVMISMGFAALENILYVYQFGLATGILRAFTAVPAHATFGILMGYFMGKVKFSDNPIKLNLFGLMIATLFHGAYDFFLFINFIPGTIIGAILSLLIGIFLANKAIKKHQLSSHFK